MHEWLAVVTILCFLLLLIVITCKSRFQEKEEIASGVLAVRSASERVASNVKIVNKKRQPRSKSSQKPKVKSQRRRTQKAN